MISKSNKASTKDLSNHEQYQLSLKSNIGQKRNDNPFPVTAMNGTKSTVHKMNQTAKLMPKDGRQSNIESMSNKVIEKPCNKIPPDISRLRLDLTSFHDSIASSLPQTSRVDIKVDLTQPFTNTQPLISTSRQQQFPNGQTSQTLTSLNIARFERKLSRQSIEEKNTFRSGQVLNEILRETSNSSRTNQVCEFQSQQCLSQTKTLHQQSQQFSDFKSKRVQAKQIKLDCATFREVQQLYSLSQVKESQTIVNFDKPTFNNDSAGRSIYSNSSLAFNNVTNLLSPGKQVLSNTNLKLTKKQSKNDDENIQPQKLFTTQQEHPIPSIEEFSSSSPTVHLRMKWANKPLQVQQQQKENPIIKEVQSSTPLCKNDSTFTKQTLQSVKTFSSRNPMTNSKTTPKMSISSKTSLKTPFNKQQIVVPSKNMPQPDKKAGKDVTVQLDFSKMSYAPENKLFKPNLMLNLSECGGGVIPSDVIPVPESKPVVQMGRSPENSFKNNPLSPKSLTTRNPHQKSCSLSESTKKDKFGVKKLGEYIESNIVPQYPLVKTRQLCLDELLKTTNCIVKNNQMNKNQNQFSPKFTPRQGLPTHQHKKSLGYYPKAIESNFSRKNSQQPPTLLFKPLAQTQKLQENNYTASISKSPSQDSIIREPPPMTARGAAQQYFSSSQDMKSPDRSQGIKEVLKQIQETQNAMNALIKRQTNESKEKLKSTWTNRIIAEQAKRQRSISSHKMVDIVQQQQKQEEFQVVEINDSSCDNPPQPEELKFVATSQNERIIRNFDFDESEQVVPQFQNMDDDRSRYLVFDRNSNTITNQSQQDINRVSTFFFYDKAPQSLMESALMMKTTIDQQVVNQNNNMSPFGCGGVIDETFSNIRPNPPQPSSIKRGGLSHWQNGDEEIETLLMKLKHH